MDLDDLFDPKVVVAVAVTAAVTSPPVRKALRRGAVYGVAGAMMAVDRVTSMAGTVAENAKHAAQSTKEAAEDVMSGNGESKPDIEVASSSWAKE